MGLRKVLHDTSPGWKHYEEVAKKFGVEPSKVWSHEDEENNEIVFFVDGDEQSARYGKIHLSLASAQRASKARRLR